MNFTAAGPSTAFALKRNSPAASRLSATCRFTAAGPIGDKPALTCASRRMGPFPPTVLLKTPTLTVNSSPGATIDGTFGVRMKLPFTSVAPSAVPTRCGLTAIATMRSFPLK